MFIPVCILLWFLGFVVIFCHEVDNNWRLYFCICGIYTREVTHVGLENSNLHAIGTTNLCILMTNVMTYSAIIGKIWKQSRNLQARHYKTLGKLLTFTIAYTFLHGPFSVTAIILMVFENDFDYSPVIKIVQILLALTVFVDPILYAWRFTDCRIEMMILLCRCNRSYIEKLRRKRNDFYSSYVIDTGLERAPQSNHVQGCE